MQEEIFGPILPVIQFDHLEDCLKILNTKSYLANPLALYIFSSNREKIEQILRETISGGVCINDTIVQYMGNHQISFRFLFLL